MMSKLSEPRWFWLVASSPSEQFDRCGAGVGFLVRALAQLYQGVRFLTSRGEYPARTVVFETASDQPLTVGQQGRGESVAGMAVHRLAVEREAQRLRAVDQAAVDAV